MKSILVIGLLLLFSSCWPSSVSFMDKGSMPEEWKTFTLKTLENNAPNTPLSYPAQLSEEVKDGIQNNTRLLIIDVSKSNDSTVDIEGVINSYNVTPIALQDNDNAAQNRLTISVNFNIYYKLPEPGEMKMTSTRFVDYDSNEDLGSIEARLLEEINTQIVQDVINKLLSNW